MNNLDLYDKALAELLGKLLDRADEMKDKRPTHNPIITNLQNNDAHFLLITLAGTANSFLHSSSEWLIDLSPFKYWLIKWRYKQATGAIRFPLKRITHRQKEGKERRSFNANVLLANETCRKFGINWSDIFKEYYIHK